MSLSEPDSLELKTSVPATWLPLAQLWQNAEQNLVGHCSEWDGKSGRVQSLHSPRMEEAQVRILEHIPGYACCLGVIIRQVLLSKYSTADPPATDDMLPGLCQWSYRSSRRKEMLSDHKILSNRYQTLLKKITKNNVSSNFWTLQNRINLFFSPHTEAFQAHWHCSMK